MTPEERWSRIENALQTVAERQALNEIEIQKSNAKIDRLSDKIEELAVKTEKNTAAIRDLIAISRTLIDSQRETDVRLKALAEDLDSLRITVRDLTASVDSFLKGLQKPNGNQ